MKIRSINIMSFLTKCTGLLILIGSFFIFYCNHTKDIGLSKGAGDSLLVISFPSKCKVYVMPENELTGVDYEVIKLTSKDHFVGTTPIKVFLSPGLYRVTVSNDSNFVKFKNDGEHQTIFTLDMKNGKSDFHPTGKSYIFSKKPDTTGIISSLFWPETASIDQFVRSLPKKSLFDVPGTSFKDIFLTKSISSNEKNLMRTMMAKTGKALWFGKDTTDYLLLAFNALGKDGKPIQLLMQPVNDK